MTFGLRARLLAARALDAEVVLEHLEAAGIEDEPRDGLVLGREQDGRDQHRRREAQCGERDPEHPPAHHLPDPAQIDDTGLPDDLAHGRSLRGRQRLDLDDSHIGSLRTAAPRTAFAPADAPWDLIPAIPCRPRNSEADAIHLSVVFSCDRGLDTLPSRNKINGSRVRRRCRTKTDALPPRAAPDYIQTGSKFGNYQRLRLE